MLFIVVKSEQKNSIMRAIMEKAGLESKAQKHSILPSCDRYCRHAPDGGDGRDMTNGLSGPRKQFLDVLRVLATCAVVLMHVLTGATDVTDASIVPEYRSLLLSSYGSGDLVCSYIFMISGYLFPESGTYIDLSGHD